LQRVGTGWVSRRRNPPPFLLFVVNGGLRFANPRHVLVLCGGADVLQTAWPSFAEKLVGLARIIGTNPRPRNQPWASALLPTVRSARAPFRELVFMSARQKRPKTAVDQYLSILFLETANLRRQLYELKKLRYRVRQAELSARNRARRTPGTHRPNPHQRPS
jgi:hypothetical protein